MYKLLIHAIHPVFIWIPLLFGSFGTAFAQQESSYQMPPYFTLVSYDVFDGYLNVRDSPGTGSNIIGELSPGVAIEYVNECIGPTGGSQNGWCHIQTSNFSGWSSVTGLTAGFLDFEVSISDESQILTQEKTISLIENININLDRRIARKLGAKMTSNASRSDAAPDVILRILVTLERGLDASRQDQITLKSTTEFLRASGEWQSGSSHSLTMCCDADANSAAKFPDENYLYQAIILPIENDLGSEILEVFRQ